MFGLNLGLARVMSPRTVSVGWLFIYLLLHRARKAQKMMVNTKENITMLQYSLLACRLC
jgi:hypothetical protein